MDRRGPAVALVREGGLLLDALSSTKDDGACDLRPALAAMKPDDLRLALLVAVLEDWHRGATPSRP